MIIDNELKNHQQASPQNLHAAGPMGNMADDRSKQGHHKGNEVHTAPHPDLQDNADAFVTKDSNLISPQQAVQHLTAQPRFSDHH